MRATDELRRMLDERGVVWHGDTATYWGDADAVESVFADNALEVSLYAISPEQAIAATLGAGTCKEVYLLMATDIGDGREEVLGAYATEEAAIAAINENQFGYALHHVRKWEVDA